MLAVLLVLAGLVGPGVGSRLRNASISANVAADQDLDDFGLDESTWDGLDDGSEGPVPSTQNITRLLNTSGASGKRNATGATDYQYPNILMLGLFNTGTNLLKKLLQLNFPGLWAFNCNESGGRCNVGDGHLESRPVWKHEKPLYIEQKLKELGQPQALKDVITVAVLRDPMSWVQSMRKAPYDLNDCVRRPDWATASCDFPASPPKRADWVCHKNAFYVQNIESVWNDWNSQYGALHQSGLLGKTLLLITYEDMVLDTKAVLGRIARAMGAPEPQSVKQLFSPAKMHGSPNGRMMAIKKLETKPYLDQYTDTQRRQVCDRLDRPLMHEHEYHDCDAWL